MHYFINPLLGESIVVAWSSLPLQVKVEPEYLRFQESSGSKEAFISLVGTNSISHNTDRFIIRDFEYLA